MEYAATQRQAQHIPDDRPLRKAIHRLDIAEPVITLDRAFRRRGADPAVPDLAGDDVDHAAHRIRPVKGRHRPAHHFDPVDRGKGRQEAGGRLAKAIGRHPARRILAAAIDQDQRIVARHAADGDVEAAGLARFAADVHALHILQGFGQAAEPLFLQFLTPQHGDAGRRLDDILLIARRGDDDRGGCIPLHRCRVGFRRHRPVAHDRHRHHPRPGMYAPHGAQAFRHRQSPTANANAYQ